MAHDLAKSIDPVLWRREDVADALVRRDIGALFSLLLDEGFTQRHIATIVDQGEPEVHAIINGRQVRAYDLLERIAVQFGIPRGAMGLGTDYPDPPDDPDRDAEADEDAVRQQFLWLAACAAVYAPLPDVPAVGASRWDVNRVGASDVAMLDDMVGRLRVLDQEQGGQASHHATIGLLQRAVALTRAQMSDSTRRALLSLITHTFSFVGWSASDAGDYTAAREHFHHSLSAGRAARDHAAIARTLHLAARNELLWGEADHALKLFQLAAGPAARCGSNLLPATITADSSIVLAEHGHPKLAYEATQTARELLSTVDMATDPAPWFQASDVTSALSATKFHMGQQDEAIEEIRDALDNTAPNRARSRAFRYANLAEFHLTAGDHDEGVEAGNAALALASEVTSARLPVRLAPVARAARHYRSSDARELARTIHPIAPQAQWHPGVGELAALYAPPDDDTD